MKASFLLEGYARDSEVAGNVSGELFGKDSGVGSGRGCCTERDGLDNLFGVRRVRLSMTKETILTSKL